MENRVGKIEENVITQLAKKRKELGISYEKLAQSTGLHRTSISLIERKKIHPTLITCLKLADALKIDLAELL